MDYFYEDNPKSNKEILWTNFGRKICENIKQNSPDEIWFPLPNQNGEIKYLGTKYKVQKVKLDE